jgi:hypothetical protein
LLFSKDRGPILRAADRWESSRFQAGFSAWSWFRQSGVVSSRPHAGNASRCEVHLSDSRTSLTNRTDSFLVELAPPQGLVDHLAQLSLARQDHGYVILRFLSPIVIMLLSALEYND